MCGPTREVLVGLPVRDRRGHLDVSTHVTLMCHVTMPSSSTLLSTARILHGRGDQNN
jgi:hypothetical protein